MFVEQTPPSGLSITSIEGRRQFPTLRGSGTPPKDNQGKKDEKEQDNSDVSI